MGWVGRKTKEFNVEEDCKDLQDEYSINYGNWMNSLTFRLVEVGWHEGYKKLGRSARLVLYPMRDNLCGSQKSRLSTFQLTTLHCHH